MNIEQAIELLKAAGFRVTKPRPCQSLSADGRPTTKQWPPNREQRYVGTWPPAFKTPGVYRPRPLRSGGMAKPLPLDWAERTAALVFFMSRRARGCVELDQLQAAE